MFFFLTFCWGVFLLRVVPLIILQQTYCEPRNIYSFQDICNDGLPSKEVYEKNVKLNSTCMHKLGPHK